MNTNEFIHNLKKRDNLRISLGTPATAAQIACVENRIGTQLPDQVKFFYQACNGLTVVDPPLRIFPLEELNLKKNSKIEFAVLDNNHVIFLDISRLNEAEQWDLRCSHTGFIITKTMASFWSNKIFAWLDNRCEIWRT